MDVLIWLQYRRFNKMKELRCDGDFIVATTDDRRDLDTFRDSPFYSNRPIIATPLLLRFMRCKGIPIRTIKEFGNLYVTSMPTEITDFDELCEWARDEIDKTTTSSKNYIIPVLEKTVGIGHFPTNFSIWLTKIHFGWPNFLYIFKAISNL